MDARERALVAINTYDILGALGWRGTGPVRRWLELAVRGPARRFARDVMTLDDAAARSDLAGDAGACFREAARGVVAKLAGALTARGADGIPRSGPALILSNHPGLTDTAALFAAIPRADLRVLAAERPFLRALPAAARRLIFIPEGRDPASAAGRAGALRAAVAHLRAGGALLTFPAGEIEPDPLVLPDAIGALDRWSASTAVFVRQVPGCVVVPVIVSGVLSRRAQAHPLTHLRRRRADREWLGAMLQLLVRTLLPGAWPVRVRVDFLEPFPPGSLPRRGESALEEIRARVAGFLRGRGRE